MYNCWYFAMYMLLPLRFEARDSRIDEVAKVEWQGRRFADDVATLS